MGRLFEEINDTLKEFLESSPVFFVATAPSGTGGHINVSPKGMDSFRVISPTQVAYIDMTGSGAETIAHIRDNGRITIMFTAFSGNPNIIRLYGKAEAVYLNTDEFPKLLKAFDKTRVSKLPGIRSIIKVDIERISDSCGFGVPLMDFVGNRDEMANWATKQGDEKLQKYRAEKNATSIDGLPAIDA